MNAAGNQDCQTMYPSSRRLKRKGEPARRREAMGYKVTLIKGKNNMVGISIGGGSPFCPCLYVVQVFHRTPAADDGSLAPGDELVNVNGTSLQGLSRRETARIIQEARVCFICTGTPTFMRFSCRHEAEWTAYCSPPPPPPPPPPHTHTSLLCAWIPLYVISRFSSMAVAVNLCEVYSLVQRLHY